MVAADEAPDAASRFAEDFVTGKQLSVAGRISKVDLPYQNGNSLPGKVRTDCV